LNRALQLLTAKSIVEVAVPLPVRPSRETRYTIADPHLRFWLVFPGPHQPEIERGRGDLVAARQGVVDDLARQRDRAGYPGSPTPLSDQLPGGPQAIGSYWTRTLTGTRSRQLNASPGSEPQRDAGNQPDCP
jgi:uncharacterized protein